MAQRLKRHRTPRGKPGKGRSPAASGEFLVHDTPAAAKTPRALRVGEEMRHALALILDRHSLDDPDLFDRRITVTEVKISPDLKNATIFVLPFAAFAKDGGEGDRLVKALNRAAAYFRGRLAGAIDLRLSPALRFKLDPSFAAAGRIETLLDSPDVARDLDSDRATGDGEAED